MTARGFLPYFNSILILLAACTAKTGTGPGGLTVYAAVETYVNGSDCSGAWSAIATDSTTTVSWHLQSGRDSSGTWVPGTLSDSGTFRYYTQDLWYQVGSGTGTISLRWGFDVGAWHKSGAANVRCGSNWYER